MGENVLHDVLDVILLLGIFISILAMAYYFTKKIAILKRGSTYTKNMEVIEVLPLAVGQVLYIVKVGEEYHLFATTKEHIQHCGRIDGTKLMLENMEEEGFKDYLSKYMKSKQEKK